MSRAYVSSDPAPTNPGLVDESSKKLWIDSAGRPLKPGEQVKFVVNGKEYVYTVAHQYLESHGYPNDKIFHVLDLNPKQFAAEAYGYTPLVGCWPASLPEDFVALTKLVNKLFHKCKEFNSKTQLEGSKPRGWMKFGESTNIVEYVTDSTTESYLYTATLSLKETSLRIIKKPIAISSVGVRSLQPLSEEDLRKIREFLPEFDVTVIPPDGTYQKASPIPEVPASEREKTIWTDCLLPGTFVSQGDLVVFNVGGVSYRYIVYSRFCSYSSGENSTIFEKLGLEKFSFVDAAYGYPSSRRTSWPTCNEGDYQALTRLVNKLFEKCKEVNGLTTASFKPHWMCFPLSSRERYEFVTAPPDSFMEYRYDKYIERGKQSFAPRECFTFVGDNLNCISTYGDKLREMTTGEIDAVKQQFPDFNLLSPDLGPPKLEKEEAKPDQLSVDFSVPQWVLYNDRLLEFVHMDLGGHVEVKPYSYHFSEGKWGAGRGCLSPKSRLSRPTDDQLLMAGIPNRYVYDANGFPGKPIQPVIKLDSDPENSVSNSSEYGVSLSDRPSKEPQSDYTPESPSKDLDVTVYKSKKLKPFL